MRHQTKNVQRPLIHLLLKSLGLNIYKTSLPSAILDQWFKSYNAICADDGHLGFLHAYTLSNQLKSASHNFFHI